MRNIFALVLVFLFIITTHQTFQKYSLDDPEARCLDGSESKIYVEQGAETKKILLFFQGGGNCGQETLTGMLESCYQRSKTDLGSSKGWSATFQKNGYLSSDNTKNQYYFNWTKAYFPYCDGTNHQGHKNQSVSYKDTNLYFRGNRIVKSQLNFLKKTYNIFETAEEVILTGASAGGKAAFVWSNHIRSLVKTSNFKVIIDSGINMNQEDSVTKQMKFQTKMTTLASLVDTQESNPFEACVKRYPNQQWRCLFFEYMYDLLQARTMVVHSQYDTWSALNIINVNCINGENLSKCTFSQMAAIEQYRTKLLHVIQLFLKDSKNSAWTISCARHVFMDSDVFKSANFRVPVGSDYSTQYAMRQFDLGNHVEFVDLVPWPDNTKCSGK